MCSKTKITRIILFCLFILALIIGGYFYFHRTPPSVVANGTGEETTSFVKEMTDEEFKEYLQEKVDKSSFHLKMDTNMVFESADSIGAVNILNPASNQYMIRVKTNIEGEEKVIYDSGFIKPKQYVQEGKLLQSIEKGVYKTNSSVSYYEVGNDKNKIGETAVVGQLSVNN